MLNLGSVINDVTKKPTQVALNLEVEKKELNACCFQNFLPTTYAILRWPFRVHIFQIINLVFLNRENGKKNYYY